MEGTGPLQVPPAAAERDNPYVGPRALSIGEELYGRRREVAELCDVIIADRIVLLYSPSGAGKSSLLEAGLRPELEKRDLRVLPTVRINPAAGGIAPGARSGNRYLVSTLLSLEEGRDRNEQLAFTDVSTFSLHDYLTRLDTNTNGGPGQCLFFDQFEELFTIEQTDQTDKAEFL